MKVVLWSTSYLKGFGGAERVVHQLACRLARRPGDQVAIAADRTGAAAERGNRWFGELPPAVTVLGASLPNPLRQPLAARPRYCLRYLSGALEVTRFLRRFRPDVVHLHLVNVDVLLLVALRAALGFRLVLTLTGGEPRLAATSALSRFKLRLAFRHADAVTCVSSDLERWAVLRGARDPRRIPNGVEPTELREEADAGGAPPRPADGEDEASSGYLVFCGRLAAVKRIDLLLDAFSESVERGSRLRLIVVGDGEEAPALAAQVRRIDHGDRIELRGALPHARAMTVLAGARGLVLASASEACPLVLLEAMALGRAVIAPDVGGVRDLVVDGVTGLLFPSSCQGSLADRMLELAGSCDHAAELGRRGALRVREHFELGAMVERYVDLYLATLAASDRSAR